MCCFMHNADVPQDIRTRILTAEINHPDLDRITVIGYQNSVANKILGPNCMMLVVKSAEWMGKENMIDFSEHPDVLKQMSQTFFPPKLSKNISRDTDWRTMLIGSAQRPHVETFEYTKDYTVVTANAPDLIPDALLNVREERRPELNQTMIDFLQEKYAGWHVILFCFEGGRLRKFDAKPVFFWYYPDKSEAQWIRFPALDAHNGKAPILGEPVWTHHHLFTSWPEMKGGVEMAYNYLPDKLRAFLPQRFVGSEPSGNFPNGDFGIYKDESILTDGKFISRDKLLRLGPEGQVEQREAALSR